MTKQYSIEDWDRQARESQSWALRARREHVQRRRKERWAFLIAALVVLVIAALTWAGKVSAMTWHRSAASVYDSSPQTASGRHTTYMVAHRWLAFGTRVRFCYRRCRTALVLDRGPFVYGREWDLNYATAGAIGMPVGVAVVRWRVIS